MLQKEKVLKALDFNKPRCIHEIVNISGLTTKSVSSWIKQLQFSGYIKKSPILQHCKHSNKVHMRYLLTKKSQKNIGQRTRGVSKIIYEQILKNGSSCYHDFNHLGFSVGSISKTLSYLSKTGILIAEKDKKTCKKSNIAHTFYSIRKDYKLNKKRKRRKHTKNVENWKIKTPVSSNTIDYWKFRCEILEEENRKLWIKLKLLY